MSSSLELKNGYTVGVLGCGNLGSAVLNAMIESQSASSTASGSAVVPGKFLAAVNSASSAERLKNTYGDKLSVFQQQNNEIVQQSDLIILGCKPFMAEKVLSPIPSELFKGKVVVSLLAGKTIESLSLLTGNNAIIARAMTNTPAKIGSGMTVVSFPDEGVHDSVRDAVDWIFHTTGKCLFLEEKHQDAATALCGSGPAFCYLVMEAMIDGAVKMGLPYKIAEQCAAQVMVGAGSMVIKEDENPAVLRTKVCTPGGTTISGLMVLEDKGVRSAMARCIEEAANVATRLGKK